ncbi:MAG: zinc ribbon domain-containing protein [Bacteroidetes bacterium]|nr:zinc ribbon domain-containing protein [Bacteroidota bacterium]
MQPKLICQSCSMPIDNIQDRGTEKDGTYSSEYCKYCYQNGAFVNPDIRVEDMKSFIEKKMQEMKLPQSVVQQSLSILPHLKRWKNNKQG